MTNKTPFFSIIIPALNEEKYLPKLLSDLKKQTYDDFEVIVIDANSKDKTKEKAEEFNGSFKKHTVLVSKEKNVSKQRNMGTKKAKGKWLIFMDADNRLPKYFLDGIRYQVHKTECDIFTTYCNVESDNPADKLIAQYINSSIEVSIFIEKPMAWGAMIGITKKGFEKVGGFDEHTRVFEDKKFVSEAYDEGLDFEIFKEPEYFFSYRRFKSEGRMSAIQRYLKLTIKNFTNTPIDQQKEYPMGGHAFKKKKSFFDEWQETFDKMAKKKTFTEKMDVLLGVSEK